MGCRVKRFLGGFQQNRHLGHGEREREKEREERKSRGIFRSFRLELGSPDRSSVDAAATAPLCMYKRPHTHTKCTAVDPERPASIAQGARSQRAHWPSRLLPSPLMLADMPQPLQSSRITPPASQRLRAASTLDSTPLTHSLTAILIWHTSLDTVTTQTDSAPFSGDQPPATSRQLGKKHAFP